MADCRQREKMPLMYSQYCSYYREHCAKNKATMHIPRKPGEQTEVDWAGTPCYLKVKLKEINERPFQKKEGSRSELFFRQEKSYLHSLPAAPYELATWKHATVQFNYHISVDHMQYSVPYEYIRHGVDVRITKDIIEVFYGDLRICSHRRLRGYPNQYSTVLAHMPKDHQDYLSWNGDRFIKWAKKIGVHATAAVRAVLDSHKVEQQGYRSCMGLLKLADKYGADRLDAACGRALTFTPRPTYKIMSQLRCSAIKQ